MVKYLKRSRLKGKFYFVVEVVICQRISCYISSGSLLSQPENHEKNFTAIKKNFLSGKTKLSSCLNLWLFLYCSYMYMILVKKRSWKLKTQRPTEDSLFPCKHLGVAMHHFFHRLYVYIYPLFNWLGDYFHMKEHSAKST